MALVTVFVVAAASGAPLTSSSFDTSNGDLYSNTNHDWNPPNTPQAPGGTANNVGPIQAITCPGTVPGSGTNCALDLTGKATDANGNGDNALGQGTKEDDTTLQIVDGQIPPNKDDLSRFYINQETASSGANAGDQFLYLAWERTNLLGSAHMDFELNQHVTDAFTPTASGTLALDRTAGDVLIDFDFGGSGPVVLTYHTWVTTGSSASTDCEASSTYPCWGKGTTLSPSVAQASVNGQNVYDYNSPNAPTTLIGSTVTKQNSTTVSSTFGEAGIDLSKSGIFSQSVCQHFGSAWLKSRSSGSSFVSELKDFIAPMPVNISNCGEIKIIKQTKPRGLDKVFSFTSGSATTLALPKNTDAGGVICTGNTTAGVQADGSFCLNDSGNTGKTLGSTAAADNSTGNTVDLVDVQKGTYSVTEGANPSGFAFDSVTCTGGQTGTTTTSTSKTATIVLAADDVVTCVYQNNQQLGAIKVYKSSTKTSSALSGAVFTITKPDSTTTTITSGTDGYACIDNLPFGNYSVQETSAPTGYKINDTTTHTVSVGTNTTCSAASVSVDTSSNTLNFTDTPLTTLEVIATGEAAAGTTKSTISCVDSSDATVGTSITTAVDPADWKTQHLTPDTYTCTVVIDP